MNNIIVKLDEVIVGIEIEAQKLLAQHITKIDIYNTELSFKVMEKTLEKISELQKWKNTTEQTKQEIINSLATIKAQPVIIIDSIPPVINEKIICEDKKNSTDENDIPTKLRSLVRHKFLFSTIFLMTNLRWAKDIFDLDCAFAKIYSDELEISQQIQNENGKERYWQEVFTLGGKSFLITNQWTEKSKQKFLVWYNNITGNNNVIKQCLDVKPQENITENIEKSNCTSENEFNKKPKSIILLGKEYKIDFWSEVFIKVCEIMVLRKPYIAIKFDQEKVLNSNQVNFSYQEHEIKVERKKLSNGIWMEVSRTAKESLAMAIKVLEVCGYRKEDMSLEY